MFGSLVFESPLLCSHEMFTRGGDLNLSREFQVIFGRTHGQHFVLSHEVRTSSVQAWEQIQVPRFSYRAHLPTPEQYRRAENHVRTATATQSPLCFVGIQTAPSRLIWEFIQKSSVRKLEMCLLTGDQFIRAVCKRDNIAKTSSVIRSMHDSSVARTKRRVTSPFKFSLLFFNVVWSHSISGAEFDRPLGPQLSPHSTENSEGYFHHQNELPKEPQDIGRSLPFPLSLWSKSRLRVDDCKTWLSNFADKLFSWF